MGRGSQQMTLDLDWGAGRHLLWVDGVNSAVMAEMVLRDNPQAIPVHCNLGKSVHPDSHRSWAEERPNGGIDFWGESNPHFRKDMRMIARRRML